MPPNTVLAQLDVDAKTGLNAPRAAELLKLHGPNVLEAEPPPSLLSLFLAQFDDRLVQILLCVAALSYGLARIEGEANGWVEPAVICAILLINAAVGVWQESSAASALDALKRLQPDKCRVLRDGAVRELPAAELVPGDVIEVRVGDRVPADARLLSLGTTTLSLDEGSLTGESATVAKTEDAVAEESRIQDKSCMLFAGTTVANGRALAVVVGTAGTTEMGKIQKGVEAARADEEKTPLAQKLDAFGDQLTWAIGAICVLVWAINFPRFWAPAFAAPWRGALYYLKVAVALGVAAIPEGLPAVITLCLSLGTRRMAARRVIVRKLPSVETLGCTTVICSDKTGTLTTNQMTVTALALPAAKEGGRRKGGAPAAVREFEVEGLGYSPTGRVVGMDEQASKSRAVRGIVDVAAMCNDAELIYEDGAYGRIGEPTEAALKVLVEKLGVPGAAPPPDAAAAASHYGSLVAAGYSKLATLEFSRARKSMSVLCRPVGARLNQLFVKGAPESVLPRCAFVRLADGTTVRMTDEWRRVLTAHFEGMATRPLRTLALAVKERGLGPLAHYDGSADAPPVLSKPASFANIESGLTFVGFAGITDPARPEVATAIASCRAAGIRVVMITGDSAQTAAAIARDVGIFDAASDSADFIKTRTFSGGEFFELSEAEQSSLLTTSNLVFCRAEPQDKQRLLKQLATLGEVAAMTGDGVNDAPALQQASIGVAMGIAGTEVAKQAADMVLADDNFATIVAAVEEGRAIYANMKSFINFLITCNVGEVVAVFAATAAGMPEVLGPIHLLWVNLVTDGPPATALGFNPPDKSSMRRPPRGRTDSLVSRFTLVRYAIAGSYVGLATVAAFAHHYASQGIPLRQLRDWSQCATWRPDAIAGFSDPCNAFAAGPLRAAASTVALTTLVAMEMLRALCAVSERESILSMPPWANPWLLVGVTLPALLHLAVVYYAPFASIFKLAPLGKSEWIAVATFSLPLLAVEEALKFVGRRLES